MQFSEDEKKEILKHFGKPLSDLDYEEFIRQRKQLFLKYHPDVYQKLGNETVNQMMNEQFQKINILCDKLENHFTSKKSLVNEINILKENAAFSIDGLEIELLTSDKDLVYHLFGAQYRWLQRGEKFKIPETNAYIIIREDHLNRSVGFRQSIKMFLTFTENDSLEVIAAWLFLNIEKSVETLIINKEVQKMDFANILLALMRTSRRLLN
jgi:hypothetical protein